MNKEDEIKTLLKDIYDQATRRHRANSNKKYLITDLEIIEEKSFEALMLFRQ